MQNDAALMLALRGGAVPLVAGGRLRGYSPELDRLLMPYAFSDVQEAEILSLLVQPRRWRVCLYRGRYAMAACAGAVLAGTVYTIVAL